MPHRGLQMEFPFHFSRGQASPLSMDQTTERKEAVSCWDAESIGHLPQTEALKLREMVETFGRRSAAAQGLAMAITSLQRVCSTDQRLYLAMSTTEGPCGTCTVLLGGLKVGCKKLVIFERSGVAFEAEPVCVLDFYVHENHQRTGVGRMLFNHFLYREGLAADDLAYDKPSPKLLSFLYTHYGLTLPELQANNFVVFGGFFAQYKQPYIRAGQGCRSASKQCSAVKAGVWSSVYMRPLTAAKRPYQYPASALSCMSSCTRPIAAMPARDGRLAGMSTTVDGKPRACMPPSCSSAQLGAQTQPWRLEQQLSRHTQYRAQAKAGCGDSSSMDAGATVSPPRSFLPRLPPWALDEPLCTYKNG